MKILIVLLGWFLGYASWAWGQSSLSLESSESVIEESISPIREESVFRGKAYPQVFPYAHHYGDFISGAGGTNESSVRGNLFQRSPGAAFWGSAILPGFSQTANKKWIRAGLFIAAEIATLSLFVINRNNGLENERRYYDYVLENWSVVQYSEFLVNYNNINGGNYTIDQLLTENANYQPGTSYYGREGWSLIDINALHELERITLYNGTSGNAFSHTLPEYDSQQYYELVSKYFQFGPGWSDFQYLNNPNFLISNWNFDTMSPQWLRGADLARDFNDELRFAGNMLTLAIVNHVVSAFDAYFTVKLRLNRLETGNSQFTNGIQLQASIPLR